MAIRKPCRPVAAAVPGGDGVRRPPRGRRGNRQEILVEIERLGAGRGTVHAEVEEDGQPVVVVAQVQCGRAGDRISLGKFEIVFIKSKHSKAVFGRVPWPGDITESLIPPAAASDYRLGEVFAIYVSHPAGSFVHLGSAAYIEGMFDSLSANTIFLSIAGREDSQKLLRCTALPLKAKQIIPIHFDNFFNPLDDEVAMIWGVDMPEFYKTASWVAPDITVRTMPIGREFVLFQ